MAISSLNPSLENPPLAPKKTAAQSSVTPQAVRFSGSTYADHYEFTSTETATPASKSFVGRILTRIKQFFHPVINWFAHLLDFQTSAYQTLKKSYQKLIKNHEKLQEEHTKRVKENNDLTR